MVTQNLAAQPTDGALLQGLVELANLQDDARGVQRFLDRWPNLLVGWEETWRALVQAGVDFERVQGRISVALKAEMVLPQPLRYVVTARDILRRAWRGDPHADALLLGFFGVGGIGLDWRRGTFVYHPQTELQRALYLLLQDSARAKICANPDCPAPYFLARKLIQRYCSPECLKPFQKQWKLRWWNEVGRKERARRLKKSRKRTRTTK